VNGTKTRGRTRKGESLPQFSKEIFTLIVRTGEAGEALSREKGESLYKNALFFSLEKGEREKEKGKKQSRGSRLKGRVGKSYFEILNAVSSQVRGSEKKRGGGTGTWR